MLINLSNHPSSGWNAVQKGAASVYENIVDLPFPKLDPWWSIEEIDQMAAIYEMKVAEIMTNKDSGQNVVHLMGELTFCFALSKKLQKRGILCIASTTERIVVENGTSKISEFRFCRFREYPRLCDFNQNSINEH